MRRRLASHAGRQAARAGWRAARAGWRAARAGWRAARAGWRAARAGWRVGGPRLAGTRAPSRGARVALQRGCQSATRRRSRNPCRVAHRCGGISDTRVAARHIRDALITVTVGNATRGAEQSDGCRAPSPARACSAPGVATVPPCAVLSPGGHPAPKHTSDAYARRPRHCAPGCPAPCARPSRIATGAIAPTGSSRTARQVTRSTEKPAASNRASRRRSCSNC
jgi:hypothetical protein